MKTLSFFLLALLLLPGCTTPLLDTAPAVHKHMPLPAPAATSTPAPPLRVMTLNLAHGRGTGFHQLFQSGQTARDNLDSIAFLFQKNRADVIALQEADSPSFWSGNFDHVDYLARASHYHRSVHARHVDGLGLAYGTALLARLELHGARAITFNPDVSPTPKGFIVSTIEWPGRPGLRVDIVSLHMSFVSDGIRQRQAQEMIRHLREHKHPLIVMGDFNAGWEGESCVRAISRALGLKAYAPEQPGLTTFPGFDSRIDWILVSPELRFRSYRVLEENVSDHRGVIAELELREPALRLSQKAD